MKNLFLLRHAKSSWKFSDLKDFDRPLNKRGTHNAPFMGKILFENKISPDLVISSPAVRAFSTAEAVCNEIEYPLDKISQDENIYEAGINDLLRIIKDVDSNCESLMLVGHNPGLTFLNNYFTEDYIENIVTCGFVHIRFDADDWKNVEDGSGILINYFYPKKFIK